MYILVKIVIKFSINYKLPFKKIENLLKSNLKIMIFVIEILLKNPIFIRFFKKIYKIWAVIFFLVLAMLILQYLPLDLI